MLSYNKDKIIIREVNKDMYHGYFQLDYMEREKFIDLVFEVNNNVSRNGVVMHCVSDVPGHLESILYFECDNKDKENIKKIADSHQMKIHTDKDLEHFMNELRHRMWGMYQLFPEMSFDETKEFFLLNFQFKSSKELKELGYDFSKKYYKPKVFISYSWKNKDIVRDLVHRIEDNNIDVWIDYKTIDYGENIFESILRGISECDIALIFISEDYKNSVMARKELISFFSRIVEQKKRWKIIKLDSVNPDEICYTLGDYKYFDVKSDSIDELIFSIKEDIREIQKL